MKVVNIFKSIQGEGLYNGSPVLFVRLGECTRNCSFCDTQYFNEFTEMSKEEVITKITEADVDTIVWTGGEPLLQIKEINDIILELDSNNNLFDHHIETNGDLIDVEFTNIEIFDYICISPKDKETCEKIKYCPYDIKVVTDLEVNKDLIPYATMLMPLTTKDEKENKKIAQKVWNYCVKNNIRYSPRLHINVWGLEKRGV